MNLQNHSVKSQTRCRSSEKSPYDISFSQTRIRSGIHSNETKANRIAAPFTWLYAKYGWFQAKNNFARKQNF